MTVDTARVGLPCSSGRPRPPLTKTSGGRNPAASSIWRRAHRHLRATRTAGELGTVRFCLGPRGGIPTVPVGVEERRRRTGRLFWSLSSARSGEGSSARTGATQAEAEDERGPRLTRQLTLGSEAAPARCMAQAQLQASATEQPCSLPTTGLGAAGPLPGQFLSPPGDQSTAENDTAAHQGTRLAALSDTASRPSLLAPSPPWRPRAATVTSNATGHTWPAAVARLPNHLPIPFLAPCHARLITSSSFASHEPNRPGRRRTSQSHAPPLPIQKPAPETPGPACQRISRPPVDQDSLVAPPNMRSQLDT